MVDFPGVRDLVGGYKSCISRQIISKSFNFKGDFMRARIRSTGEVVEVMDYGEKMHPRYWGSVSGYDEYELEFLPEEPEPVSLGRKIQMEG